METFGDICTIVLNHKAETFTVHLRGHEPITLDAFTMMAVLYAGADANVVDLASKWASAQGERLAAVDPKWQRAQREAARLGEA